MNEISAKEKSMNEFIKTISSLLNKIDKKRKDDEIKEIIEKYQIGRKEVPSLIIEYGGPHIWEFREELKRGDILTLLKVDFNERAKQTMDDVFNNSNYGDSPDKEKYDKMYSIIGKIKILWYDFTSIEQKIIITDLQNLVKQYAIYSVECKKEQK